MGREDKGEVRDRGDLVEKKTESKEGESDQASNDTPKLKMGTEDWVFKGTKLIKNTKN